ncbi:hypothetical protein ACH5RR_022842 [Cinchona calisaya]|uniref:FBD domain-containing protein n=1 Tax=Cinchona calisaya TaxID=153742 RepID=A0ABD2ZCC9_9GENT
MSGEVLEFILHNYQYLEHLVVRGSNNLINVEVSGPLALKHLEICFCYNIECLTKRDADLVSLKVSSVDTLVLNNVQMLTEVHVYSYSPTGVRGVIAGLSCYLLKLEILTLCIAYDEAKQVSSNLEKLVIKMNWVSKTVRRRRKLGKTINYSLQRLKVFELSGFLGCTSDIELVKYFLENAAAFEKIIISPRCDPGDLCCLKFDYRSEETEKERDARRRAEQHLCRLIPSRVELVIL